MARGGSRAFSETLAALADKPPTRTEVTPTPSNKVGKELIALGRRFSEAAAIDPELDKKLADFVKAWGAYQGERHFEKKGHKQRRQDLADTVKALPKEIQDAISVPPSYVKRLYRGGNHATNPGPDGTIVSSFTDLKEHAEDFGRDPQRYDSHKRYDVFPPSPRRSPYDMGKTQNLYRAWKDVESFDRILSFGKALAFIWGMRKSEDKEFEKVLDENLYDALPEGSTKKPDAFTWDNKPLVSRYTPQEVRQSRDKFYRFRGKRGNAMDELFSYEDGEDTEYQPDEYGWDGQNEYIITNLKWKPGVK